MGYFHTFFWKKTHNDNNNISELEGAKSMLVLLPWKGKEVISRPERDDENRSLIIMHASREKKLSGESISAACTHAQAEGEKTKLVNICLDNNMDTCNVRSVYWSRRMNAQSVVIKREKITIFITYSSSF